MEQKDKKVLKLSNFIFLEQHYHVWTTWQKAHFFNHLTQDVKEAMLRIVKEEFQPKFHADLWCPHCIPELLTELFTSYDKWKEANKREYGRLSSIVKRASFKTEAHES